MPNRTLRSTKLSARVAYAQIEVSEEKNQKRGRGRPRLNPVSATLPLSKATKKDKATLRKRKRSSGNVGAKVENNSSEADCSSEGEERISENEDDDSKEPCDENSENEEVSNENDTDEEISSSNEESEPEILIDTDKSETGGMSVKSIGDEEDENEVRYSLPNTKQDNILESSKKQKMNKIKKRSSSQKSLPTSERKFKGSYQIDSSSPKSFRADFKNQKMSSENHSLQDEDSTVSSSDKKESKRYDNSSINKRASGTSSKDSQISKQILKEIIGKYEHLKRKYKHKNEDDLSEDSMTESSSAKRFKTEKKSLGIQKTYKFDNQFKSFSSQLSLGKLEPKYPHCAREAKLVSVVKNSPLCGNVAAEGAFRWLLNPLEPEDFFLNIFEKRPYHINRKKYSYFKELFNCDNLNTLLKENDLMYGVHIDVLKYENDERKPVEAVGKAYNSNVWDDFKQGYSVRLRNPQAYNKNIWNFCSLLQEYFSSSVGCNVYLTPSDSQGFPPHYDDIDAFIVQVEGAKMWKVYPPRNASEELARYPSADFQQSEIGQPMLEIFLKPGDMLYIPRGYIHQAFTGSLEHSLHLTFSTNQLNTWGDLMLQATQKAIEKAILNEVEFRKSIPRDLMNFAGSAIFEDDFMEHCITHQMKSLTKVSLNYLDVNEAFDAHAQRFIRCSLPPVFNKIEKQNSIHGNGTQWKDGEIVLKSSIDLNTHIRLIRKRNLRLIIDDSGPKLYHSLENKRDPVHPDSDNQEIVYIDFDMAAVQPFTYLLQAHPKFVKVSDLPMDDFDSRINFAASLYENGLLMTKDPLKDLKDMDWNTLLVNDINVKKENSFFNL